MEIKQIILEKIKEYNRIFIFRHIRIDGDCVGASRGLREIIRLTWPEKEVRIIDDEHSDYLSFLGEDDAPVPDEMYTDALAIVVDTASETRISNPKYALCREIIRIDHHIPVSDFGDFAWIEEERASCSELIVEFYNTFRDELKIDQKAATFLYVGMVTDTGRFRYRSVNGDTMRCAGILLDLGVDTDRLYAELYLDSYENLKFKAAVYEKMQITANGVAYIIIDRAMQDQYKLSFEQACACVSLLDSIRGCLCWIAFIEEQEDNRPIRVRLRSRFFTVNEIAEGHNGGGHACASGASAADFDEVMSIVAEADSLLKDYKETHEGWL